MPFDRELEEAMRAVRDASRLCRSVRSALGSKALQKDDRSPVTVADFGSQAIVCRTIGLAFPDDPIIAEEDSATLRAEENRAILDEVVSEVARVVPGAEAEAVCAWIDRGNAHTYTDRFWALDPIDGTKGFLRGDQYAIALALIVDGRLDAAVLACPNLSDNEIRRDEPGVLFGARRGEGAFRAPLAGPAEGTPVRVSDVSSGPSARICESFVSAHSSHEDAAAVAEYLGIVRDPLRIDSQAKYGVVAEGEADIYLRLTSRTGYVEKIWDHAAGALVVAEAGGRVTDLDGRPLDFSRGVRLDRNVGIVATNGRLHGQVLEALAHVLAPS